MKMKASPTLHETDKISCSDNLFMFHHQMSIEITIYVSVCAHVCELVKVLLPSRRLILNFSFRYVSTGAGRCRQFILYPVKDYEIDR